VDAIIQHADRITRLIQQLLTFARTKEQPMATLAVQEPLVPDFRNNSMVHLWLLSAR
jgi:hypothetical protein